MYAINIGDWAVLQRDSFCLSVLIRPVVGADNTANCEPGHIDGEALVFTCDDERSAVIVEVARKHFEKWELRFYHKTAKAKKWTRV